ncbi:MAG: SDR family NAD(P)-dependent oxidoreductase [Deltaproteobacteria bacterium]|nr:SDR family NAD(P)-dependent oxidoreductase [Deltaproteobacteria bacterium]
MKIDRNTVAVVTGAASGIGRALALRLAQADASLALSDVNEVALQETAQLVKARGVNCSTHRVDVSDEERVQAFVQEVMDAHGRASLVINNAGVALLGTVEELSTADIAWLMGINFWGVVYGTKYFLPILQQQPSAHLVNISSVFGLIGFPGQSAYNASKFAVRGFTEALRHELEGSTVRVSCVHPGGIKTSIARAARLGTGADPALVPSEIARFDKLSPTTAEQAAERIVRGIERDEARILIGSDAGLIDRLQRLLPVNYWQVFRRILAWQLR